MNEQETAAQEYIQKKQDYLRQCIALTKQLTAVLGDIPQAHQILQKRKQLLQQLDQLDGQYAYKLAGYTLSESDLNTIADLAEEMWDLDNRYTELMKQNKQDIHNRWQNLRK